MTFFQTFLATDKGYDMTSANQKGMDMHRQKTQGRIQGNYLKVEVYYQTLNVKTIKQQPIYPVSFDFII